MKYTVVSTKAGWAVQDARTYVVVFVAPNKDKATEVANRLNTY